MNRPNSSEARVLIVEDEFLLALQLEDILEDGGHMVVATLPDSQSLQRLADAPDIALVDLNLRDGLTGPDVARELSSRYGIPVIYVTANPAQIGDPADTAVGVVQKPFTREAILGAISFALHADRASPPAGLEPIRSAA